MQLCRFRYSSRQGDSGRQPVDNRLAKWPIEFDSECIKLSGKDKMGGVSVRWWRKWRRTRVRLCVRCVKCVWGTHRFVLDCEQGVVYRLASCLLIYKYLSLAFITSVAIVGFQ